MRDNGARLHRTPVNPRPSESLGHGGATERSKPKQQVQRTKRRMFDPRGHETHTISAATRHMARTLCQRRHPEAHRTRHLSLTAVAAELGFTAVARTAFARRTARSRTKSAPTPHSDSGPSWHTPRTFRGLVVGSTEGPSGKVRMRPPAHFGTPPTRIVAP